MLTFKNIWMINFDTFVFNTYKTPPQKKTNPKTGQAEKNRAGRPSKKEHPFA